MSSKKPILTVNGLSQHFSIPKPQKEKTFTQKIFGGSKQLKAVDDITFEINEGEVFGLVGESGSGKSTTGRSIIRLYDPTHGEVMFDGRDISKKLTKAERLDLARDMQMIFQDPYASVNPRLTVEEIIGEGIRIHQPEYSRAQRKQKIIELLEKVGLSETHISRYPHEFSGGQLQRIGIARALAVKPKLIIADEAISALDVSIQAQVVNLMKDLQRDYGLTYLFIAHDLSMVKYISDRIGVMHKGRLVEVGTADDIYNNPIHPYTKSLLSAIPHSDPAFEKTRTRIKYNPAIHQYTKDNQPSFHQISDTQRVLCTDEELKVFLEDKVEIKEKDKVVERATTSEIFDQPLHPYTRTILGMDVIEVKTAQDFLQKLPSRMKKLDDALPKISTTVDQSIVYLQKEVKIVEKQLESDYSKFSKKYTKTLEKFRKNAYRFTQIEYDRQVRRIEKLKEQLEQQLSSVSQARSNYDEENDTSTIALFDKLESTYQLASEKVQSIITDLHEGKENLVEGYSTPDSDQEESNSETKVENDRLDDKKQIKEDEKFEQAKADLIAQYSSFTVIINNTITQVKIITDLLPISTEEEQDIISNITKVNVLINEQFIPELTKLNNQITNVDKKVSELSKDKLATILTNFENELKVHNLYKIRKKHSEDNITQVSEIITLEFKIVRSIIFAIKYLEEYNIDKTKSNTIQKITSTHEVYSTELEKEILQDIYRNNQKDEA